MQFWRFDYDLEPTLNYSLQGRLFFFIGYHTQKKELMVTYSQANDLFQNETNRSGWAYHFETFSPDRLTGASTVC